MYVLIYPLLDLEYTDCTSEESYPPPLNECPRYDTKQSDDEVPVMLGSDIYGSDRSKQCTDTKLNCLKLNCFHI